MSFSFSFSGDDIENELDTTDSNDATEALAVQLSDTTIVAPTLIKPQRHSFAELLTSLPSQLSYNVLEISPVHNDTTPTQRQNGSQNTISVPRRALFDIRQQLMHEVDPTASTANDSEDPTSNLLAGLETGDLSTGIYEGGFKTWECAVDLASLLLSDFHTVPSGGTLHVIELGSGSAIPSLVLLKQSLQRGRRVKFTLCDYNKDVLRLCTATNVFMTVALREEATDDIGEGELDIEDDSVAQVLQTLQNGGTEIDFVSGPWGSEFVGLLDLRPNDQILVVASETIYSPASLEVFTKTVLDIIRRSATSQVLVAAKKVYFGVGGGVQEFLDVLQRQGGNAKSVLDVPGAGVGRVVLQIYDKA